jgi:hypothetical protein
MREFYYWSFCAVLEKYILLAVIKFITAAAKGIGINYNMTNTKNYDCAS